MMTASAIESDSLGIVSSFVTSVLELGRRQVRRERRLEPALAHPLQLVGELALELVELRRGHALRLELGAQDDDRVTPLPLVELSLGAVGAGVAPGMADEAVRDRLDE